MFKLFIARKKTVWWTRCNVVGCRVDNIFGVVRTWWPRYRCYSYSFYVGRVQFFYLNTKKYSKMRKRREILNDCY